MGKKAPAPPPPPDPVATARAQGEMNAETARLQNRMNRLDQVTPYGNLTFEDIGNDRARVTQTLSEPQQRQLDLTNQAQELYGTAALSQLRGVQDTLSRPFQFYGSNIPQDIPDRTGLVATTYSNRDGEFVRNVVDRTGEIQRTVQDRTGDVMRRADFTGVGDPNQARSDVEAALFARMNPQLEQQRAALEARLVNQGITPGSAAWETGMRDYAQMANDARYGAILNAGQEQSRIFGLGFGQAGLNNEAVGQQMNNDLQRGQFANAATQQALDMDLARAGFSNQTTQQLNQAEAARLAFGNQAAQQLYSMDIGRRQAALQEQLALRAQPLNEAAALLSGQQVQMPQFQNVPQVQVAAPDYQGAIAQNYAGQVAANNARVQQVGAQNAALANFAGQLGGAALGFAGGGFGGMGFGGGGQWAMSPQGTKVPIVSSFRPA